MQTTDKTMFCHHFCFHKINFVEPITLLKTYFVSSQKLWLLGSLTLFCYLSRFLKKQDSSNYMIHCLGGLQFPIQSSIQERYGKSLVTTTDKNIVFVTNSLFWKSKVGQKCIFGTACPQKHEHFFGAIDKRIFCHQSRLLLINFR